MKINKFGKIVFGILACLTIGNLTANAAEVATITGKNVAINKVGTDGNTPVGTAYIECTRGGYYKLEYSYNNSAYQTWNGSAANANGIVSCEAGDKKALNFLSSNASLRGGAPEANLKIKITAEGENDINNLTPVSNPQVFSQDILFTELFGASYYTDDEMLYIVANGFPLGTHFTIDRVTDVSTLRATGSDYTYMVKFTAGGKDNRYFMDKYYANIEHSYPIVNPGKVKLPNGLTPNEDLYAYTYSKELNSNTYSMDSADNSLDGVFTINDNGALARFYDNGFIAFKYKDEDNNFIGGSFSVDPTEDNNQVVNVPNTAANMRLIIFVISGLLISVGGVIISRNIHSKNN